MNVLSVTVHPIPGNGLQYELQPGWFMRPLEKDVFYNRLLRVSEVSDMPSTTLPSILTVVWYRTPLHARLSVLSMSLTRNIGEACRSGFVLNQNKCWRTTWWAAEKSPSAYLMITDLSVWVLTDWPGGSVNRWTTPVPLPAAEGGGCSSSSWLWNAGWGCSDKRRLSFLGCLIA